MLCLETSQVCTSLFYLHWNVRKILLVSFISLHERLLLFQLGIIRKNCKYNCLSHLIKKKKKVGQNEKAHQGTQTFLTGRVRLDSLAQFSWGFYGCNDLSEWKQSKPTFCCSQDWPAAFPVTKTFFLFHFPISFCLHATEVIPSVTETSRLAGWRGRHDHKPSCTAVYPTALHRHWDADCSAWNPLGSHQCPNLPPKIQVILNNFYLGITFYLLNSRLVVRLDLCVCVWESLYVYFLL